MHLKLLRFYAITASLLLLIPAFAYSQVNGPGPSDPALFDTVINLPQDPSIGFRPNVGGIDGQTTQLNVMEGGSVSSNLEARFGSEVNVSGGEVGVSLNAFSGSEVNVSSGKVGDSFDANSGSKVGISGGTVGLHFSANSGSEVNISGGSLGKFFDAESGSKVNISGGNVGSGFEAFSGSSVELIGGEFRLNGDAFAGSSIALADNDVFTGTLQDGSAFVFSPLANAFVSIHGGDDLSEVTLTAATLPTLNTSPRVVSTDISAEPSGLRAGQSLTLQDSGALGENFAVVNATLNIEGGVVGSGLETAYSTVNISGGAVDGFEAYAGSELNISGGEVGFRAVALSGSKVNISGGTVSPTFRAESGSTVNISGGVVGRSFNANSGSEVNISGGMVLSVRARFGSEVNLSGGNAGRFFNAESGSEVNISGGTLGPRFQALSGSDVELIGGEFLLNGDAFAGSSIALADNDVFTGTLQDGSAFVFSSEIGDDFSAVTLTETALPTLDTSPRVVSTDISAEPSGLRTGQSLTLQDGGVLGENFAVVDATLNIEGGVVGIFLETVRSTVNISGGIVRDGFQALSGSEVNIRGGIVENRFDARSGSTVNISGGIVRDGFQALSGSELNLLGTDFLLDGVLLESLVAGDPFTIAERDVQLSGLLADGTPFDFDVNETTRIGGFFFSPGSTLTVTLVGEGDFDFDGDVDGDDVDFYIASIGELATGEFAKLDLDDDGVVTLADHNLHVRTLVTTSNGDNGALLGDINLDGSVDVLGDVALLLEHLGQSVSSRAQGDLNADGVVDVLGDAALLINSLGNSNVPSSTPASAAVPEPGCLVVFVAGGLALSSRRRKSKNEGNCLASQS